MFGKLMKYEMKSLGKNLLPLYGAVLALALLNGIGTGNFLTSGTSVLMGILAVVYSALCVAVAVLTIMTVVQRFYKGLLGDEGYLMHTLPVSPVKLVLSKFTGAVLMSLLAVLVGVLSAFLQMGRLGHIVLGSALEPIRGTSWPLFLAEFAVLCIFTLTALIAQIYLAMALGHLSSKHRAALSFVWYLAISVVISLVNKILTMAGVNMDLVGQVQTTMAKTYSLWEGLDGVMVIGIVEGLIKTVLFTFGTTWVLKNKLNLE